VSQYIYTYYTQILGVPRASSVPPEIHHSKKYFHTSYRSTCIAPIYNICTTSIILIASLNTMDYLILKK